MKGEPSPHSVLQDATAHEFRRILVTPEIGERGKREREKKGGVGSRNKFSNVEIKKKKN